MRLPGEPGSINIPGAKTPIGRGLILAGPGSDKIIEKAGLGPIADPLNLTGINDIPDIETPEIPEPEAPPVIPDADPANVLQRERKRRTAASNLQRGGRASTIMSQSAGGTLG